MTDSKKCPYCGKQLHNNAQYCMFCMHSLQPKKDVTPPEPSRIGKLILVVFGIIILFFGLLSVGIYSAFGRGTSGDGFMIAVDSGEKNDVTSLPESVTVTEKPTVTEPNNEEAVQPSEIASSDIPSSSLTGESHSNAPQTTNPVPSVPNVTSPVTPPTTPPTTPPITQPPEPVCNHYYIEATCIAPMTCVYCNHSVGGVDSAGHNWSAETAVVHHDEVGHYEEQVDYVKKTVYLCFFCGYNQDGYDSIDELREHITVHSHEVYYNNVFNHLESFADTREVWEPVTVTVWVVDQSAYDETVVTGYTCTLCGNRKDP